jgi:hypothetical protein
MPATPVHPTDAATRITVLRDAVQRLADELDAHGNDVIDAGTAADLAVERWCRLAAYSLTHAARGGDLSDDEFSFQYVALALLEPDGDRYRDEGEFPALAFGAVRKIAEFGR